MPALLSPPFVPPDPTDPLATANAGLGYAEFNALKLYLISWIATQFDPTTGLFKTGYQILPSAIPAFTGDATSTAGTTALTVKGINGTALSGLATGVLVNTTITGVPTIANNTTQFPGNSATATSAAGLNGQALSALATGLLKNTTATGVPVIASAALGGDYTPAAATVKTGSASYTATLGVNVFMGTTTGQTITLPTPVGQVLAIKIKNQSTQSVTVASASGSQIWASGASGAAATVAVTTGNSLTLFSDGTYWNQ